MGRSVGNKYVLALDQGTTSSRAVVIDSTGSVRSVAQRELTQFYPEHGWVEQDPDEIWTSQLQVAREALQRGGLSGGDLAAIGVANQRETTLVWDRTTGRPVYNAIVWQDRRTASLCEQVVSRGQGTLIKQKTGLVVDPYFSATKIRWILDNVSGARTRAETGELAFGTVDSWILWNLTGGETHATDLTNAARTMVADIHTGDWDAELLEIFGIPRGMMPEVKGSSQVFAYTRKELLGNSIPIGGLAGDQQASLFGQGCSRPGMLKNTYGTGCFLMMNTGETAVESESLLTTPACHLGDKPTYALEGSIFSAGATIQWLRDELGLIGSSSEVEELALNVPDAGGVYLVPAFSGLGAPHWDPYARGLIIGLTRGTNKGHLARAALDSIAHQSADVVEAIKKCAGIEPIEMRVDGGASTNHLLMQSQADFLGIPVVRSHLSETTVLGAAYLAGLAVGYWDSLDTIEKLWQEDRRFLPSMAPEKVRESRNGWALALDRSKGWAKP